MKMKMPMRIGLDFGGVMQPVMGDDTSDSVAEIPLMTGCIDGVKKLIDSLGSENVFIVSKASSKTQKATLQALRKADFFSQNGFLEENIRFTPKRNGIEGKWPVIVNELNLTHFVDDNWSMFADPLIEELTSNFFRSGMKPERSNDSSSATTDDTVVLASLKISGSQNKEQEMQDHQHQSVLKDHDPAHQMVRKIHRLFFCPESSKPNQGEARQLDRSSDDKKSRNDGKRKYACGKEEYYREYQYSEVEKLDGFKRVADWTELIEAILGEK